MKIKKVSESIEGKNAVKLPTKDGWYWVIMANYTDFYGEDPIPCWFSVSSGSFIPGGIGGSKNDVYEDDIDRVGPEIIVPKF